MVLFRANIRIIFVRKRYLLLLLSTFGVFHSKPYNLIPSAFELTKQDLTVSDLPTLEKRRVFGGRLLVV